MTYQQAMEWELFNRDNPPVMDQIMVQIAKISHLFASYFIPKGDKQPWDLSDFYPYPSQHKTEVAKVAKPDLKKQLLNWVKAKGDSKAKNWAGDRLETSPEDKMVQGTDGNYYKYASEEFIKPRTTPPRIKKG